MFGISWALSLVLSILSFVGSLPRSTAALLIPHAVSVSPTAGQEPTRSTYTNGYTAVFTVKNTGTLSDTWELWCQSSTNITCSSINPAGPVTLSPNATVNVTVTYNTGAAGSGWFQLYAADGSFGHGTYSVQVGSSTATVTPHGGTATGDPYLPYTQAFTVTAGVTSAYVNLTPTCSGSGVASSCSVSPTSMSLDANGQATATVSYWTRADGTTGRVTLKAFDAQTQALHDSGWVTVTVGAAGGTQSAPQVAILNVDDGTTIEPSLCLTVALGSGAASACGDLRLVHALPTLRTLNQRRTPVLLYSSALAEPLLQVAAHVWLPSGAAFPDSITAKLRVSGVPRDSGKWTGNEWVAGRPRRMLLSYTAPTISTGIYYDTLEVKSWYANSPYSTTVTSRRVVINRRQSPFGAGWWLAGLEWLDPSTKLWIGGDGSARVYQATGIQNTWAAPVVDAPDTLVYVNGEYIRRGPGKLEVHFNATGQHVSTINRLGHTTSFAYDGQGRLSTITVPAPAGASARKTYYFQYATGTVSVTDSLSSTDTLKHQVVVYLSSSGRVDSIADGGGHVRFGYPDTSSRRVTTRTDRRGAVRKFTYDPGGRVTNDSLSPGTGLAWIVLTLRPIESQGLHGSGTPSSVDSAVAYTLVDGPRTDVGDSTMFWLDRYGAPRKIQDAMGGLTRLYHSNSYPALVIQITRPDSGVVSATYDARGHVASVTDSNAFVRGSQVPVTTNYTWDPVFDAVTSVRKPEYGRDTIYYDPTTGNRLWEQNPAGYRVQYSYYATNDARAPGLLASVKAPGASAVDTVIYDATLGNVDSVRTPQGFWARYYAENRGRDTLVVSPVDSQQARFQKVRTIYDAMDRATWTGTEGPVSPYYNNWTVRWDSMWANTLGRTNTYDAEGNLTQVSARTESGPDSTLARTYEYRYYDLAGRDTSHTLASVTTRIQYDAAGNPTQVTTPRATTTMVYDAMNRLTTRIVPTLTYSSEGCTGVNPACRWAFPLYPNDGGTGLTFPADTARFTYDIAGRMLTADNRDARIRRTYAKNGWLLTDTLKIRNYGSMSFSSQYFFGLALRYDSLGRRLMLKAGAASFGPDSILYFYNGQTGALQEVRSPAGDRFVYADDSLGRQVSLAVYDHANPNTMTTQEARTYDGDDRLRTRVTTALDTLLQRDSLWYDAQGKVVRASSYSRAIGTAAWSLTYGGLGGTIYTEMSRVSPSDHRGEEWRRDAFGNPVWRGSYGATGAPLPQRMHYDTTHGSRLADQGTPTYVPGTWWYPDSTYFSYDASGNLHYRNQAQRQATWPYLVTNYVVERHYYGADDRLRVVERADLGQFPDNSEDAYLTAPARGVWEEYRYDALGRRVMVRARRDQLSDQTYAASTLDRVVWDGNQILYELRAAGYPDNALDGTPFGYPNAYGKIGYVHGRDLDEPLALMDGRVPLRSWRGNGESSVWTTGQAADCTRLANCDTLHLINWPETRWSVDMYPWDASGGPENYRYVGSLIQGSQDGTGMMYRRNRYYDPQSARFTQIDPIGLAGGLSVYGFAGGDPVSYTDPFGLCVFPASSLPCGEAIANWGARTGRSWAVTLGAAVSALGAATDFLQGGGCNNGLTCGMGVPGAPGGGGSLFSGTRAALRDVLRSGWVEGVSGRQGLAILARLGKSRVDGVSVAAGEGGNVVASFTRLLESGKEVTVRTYDMAGKELSTTRQVYDASGALAREGVIR